MVGIPRIIRDAEGNPLCPECGCFLEDERSLPHHRAFFGFLKHVFKNWPKTLEFQPNNEDHLRAFLLVEAGHRAPQHVWKYSSKRGFRLAMLIVRAEMRSDRARGVYGWPAILEGGIVILRPASIAFHNLSQKRFNEITDSVLRVVYERTAIDFDEWKGAHR